MFEHPWHAWLNAVSSIGRRARGRVGTSKSWRPRCQVAIEPLEDRLALSFLLGTTSLVEGPQSGVAADIVVGSGPWSAHANSPWIHTQAKGVGNGQATFSFNANPGGTRTGTLTIAGQTVVVTQAGKDYAPANAITLVSSGLAAPAALAVDRAGKVYVADQNLDTIDVWNPATQTLSTLLTGPANGIHNPRGLAVDGAGNLYITDGDKVVEWHAATGETTTLVTGNPYSAIGLAVDGAGNVYLANFGDSEVDRYDPATQTVSTLVSAKQLHEAPWTVAVDLAGNVYITSASGHVKEWHAQTNTVTTLVTTENPFGTAVDGSGNVYYSSYAPQAGRRFALQVWQPTTKTHHVIATEPQVGARAVVVDPAGNIYLTDPVRKPLIEVPRAFVPVTPFRVHAGLGSGRLEPVLTNGTPLTGLFAPTTDQNWLEVGATPSGHVSFAFAENTGPARRGHILVLGRQVAVIQAGG